MDRPIRIEQVYLKLTINASAISKKCCKFINCSMLNSHENTLKILNTLAFKLKRQQNIVLNSEFRFLKPFSFTDKNVHTCTNPYK